MAKSKKVNKWEAAPESIKLLHNAFTAFNTINYEELDAKVDWDELDELLVDVLKAYNELEAKHNADCGLISKLEEENKSYNTLAAELHNDADELERTINNLKEMVEFHKGEVKKLVKTADQVRDKHENEVCMLKKDISDLEVKVKHYKEDIEDLECEVSKYKALYEGAETKLDRVTRERNNIEYTLDTLIEQLKVKNDIYVNPEASSNGIYEIENKRAADLQEDLDTAILDLRKEGEHSLALSKVITRKNAEMCNLKWERDETEKKIKILTEELISQYNINVTFYQRPGIDMHGLKNFGVHIDCEENRKAFNELKEALDKHKSQINKLEEKHAKATRFISRLTEALNEAGVEFHYVKFNGDGEEIFYIIKNYEARTYKLKKDKEELERRSCLLLKALDQAGIHPIFDNRANKWRIQYTGKAENAFLAADQIKRDAEKKIDKLVSALDKCRLDAKWDHENDKWCIYVKPSDTELTSVSVNLCEVVEGYEKLKEENKILILEKENLKSKNRSWQVSYNAVQKKVGELTAERDGLNDYAEALKKGLNAIYGYRDTDNPCGICKNFDPKE